MQQFAKESKWYLLLLITLLLLSIYFYCDTISLFPSNIHAWTQSDRLALAWCFLDNGFNLFKPCTYNLETIDGITGVDFPIVEYVIALLMKVLGTKAPVIFRVFILCISFVGYFFLFKLTQLITASTSKAFFVVIFTFTLPVLSYYQAGFIPSVPAFVACLVGYFYYAKYLNKDVKVNFHLAILFFVLATLIRKPFIIFLCAVCLQTFLKQIQERKINIYLFLSPLIGFILFTVYYLYNMHLSETYGARFLTHLTPASTLEELYHILNEVWKKWTFQYFTKYHYIAFLTIFILGIRNWFSKSFLQKNKFIRAFTIHGLMISFLAIVYFLAMSKQYVDHEYYFIDSFYLGIILLLISGLAVLNISKQRLKILSFIFGGILLLGAVIDSKKVQEKKHAYASWDRGEVTRKNFIDSDIFLDSLGIGRDQKVLVIDAYSTNGPLLQMDRKGYALVRNRKNHIVAALKKDFDYIVTQDVFLPSDIVNVYPEIIKHLKRIGGNGKISVFKLSNKNINNTMANLLGIDSIAYLATLNDTQDWFNIKYTILKNQKDSCLLLKTGDAFGPTFKKHFTKEKIKKVLLSGDFSFLKSPNKVNVVCTVSKNGKQIYYSSYILESKINNVFTSKSFLFILPEELEGDFEISIYLWKRNKGELCSRNLELVFY